MNQTQLYQTLLEEIDAGHRAVLLTVIENQTALMHKRVITHKLLHEIMDGDDPVSELVDKLENSLHHGTFYFEAFGEDRSILVEPYFPEPQLLVFGGGHIALPLVEFAAKAGFKVTVVDDRPSFANPGRFPAAERVICENFSKAFETLKLTPSTFVVIVTRGHRHDKMCLEQVMHYKTAYTGMIGSRRRIQGLKELLISEGHSEALLERVCAPIGLEIGAVTPEEIAISILAQVIQYKRNTPGTTRKTNTWPELDLTVLHELAAAEAEPRALVTVVATKGSVPRREGAKMIVWPDGRIVGSIGGGCSEGDAIQAAYEVIREGQSRYLDIDMTGSVAEEEGMVCGGVMKVLIERV